MSIGLPEAVGGNGRAVLRRPRAFARFRLVGLVEPSALLGVVVVVGVMVCAAFPGVVAPHDPNAQNLSSRLFPPGTVALDGTRHWLGTDWLGRDLFSRIVYGARISMSVAALAVLVRGVLGVSLGLVSGFYGGVTESAFMRLADIQLALPFLLLAIALAAVISPSLATVVGVLGVTGWMAYARLVRAQVLSLREKEFIEAARALGIPNRRIITRHILPNVLGSAIALATIDVPAMVLAESSLSFLGIGVPLSAPSWGGMVALGRNHLVTAWWVPVLPGMAIVLVVLGVSLLGDWLRDELDPTLSGQ